MNEKIIKAKDLKVGMQLRVGRGINNNLPDVETLTEVLAHDGMIWIAGGNARTWSVHRRADVFIVESESN